MVRLLVHLASNPFPGARKPFAFPSGQPIFTLPPNWLIRATRQHVTPLEDQHPTESWRFGSDHVPFFSWVICRWTLLIFQGVQYRPNAKENKLRKKNYAMQYRSVCVSICMLSSILNGMHCMVSFQHHTMIWIHDINNIQQELSTSHGLMLGHLANHQLFCCLKSPDTRMQGGQRWCLVTRKRQFSYFSGEWYNQVEFRPFWLLGIPLRLHLVRSR